MDPIADYIGVNGASTRNIPDSIIYLTENDVKYANTICCKRSHLPEGKIWALKRWRGRCFRRSWGWCSCNSPSYWYT